jgi:ribose 1,5-bisphosphokinase PhnN
MQSESVPGPFLIPIVGMVTGTIMTIVLVYPFVRAWAKRLEQRGQASMPADVNARLARIEAAVDSIAIEVERISESQRFLTKLQSGSALPPTSASSERPR